MSSSRRAFGVSKSRGGGRLDGRDTPGEQQLM
jgi:hypothetical protein